MRKAGTTRSGVLMAISAIAFYWAAVTAFGFATSELRQEVYLRWFNTPEMHWAANQAWVLYNLPFVFLGIVGYGVIGWAVGTIARQHRAVVLSICVACQVLMALPWALETWRLSEIFGWTHPLTRRILSFTHFVMFVVYPACLFLGFISTRSNGLKSISADALSMSRQPTDAQHDSHQQRVAVTP
jgi:hypothetical protein